MEYVIQIFEWLPTVKISLGKGITVSLLQILLFPLVCQVIKILFNMIVSNLDISIGKTVKQEGEVNTYDDDNGGDYAQVGKKVYYIPNDEGYTNHE